MIIFGTQTTKIAGEDVAITCAHCGTFNKIQLYIYQRYIHIFWIPIFPDNKIGLSQCSHCKQLLKYNEMPASYKTEIDTLNKNSKTPWWTFLGPLIVVAIIATGMTASFITNKKLKTNVESLKKNDVVTIKKHNLYTYYQVDTIKDSVIIFKMSSNSASDEKQLRLLAGMYPDNYAGKVDISKSELSKMIDDNKLININSSEEIKEK